MYFFFLVLKMGWMPKYIKMQQNRLLGLFGEERAIFKPITLKNITNGVIKIKGVDV